MRIVEYQGFAVKRQKKVGPDRILLTFFTRPPMVVSVEQWELLRRNRFFDDPNVRRRDVVRERRW